MIKSDYSSDFEQACELAEQEGFEVIRSSPTTLLLDLDDGMHKYNEMRGMAKSLYGFVETARWWSKSGDGRHVVLTSTMELTMPERLLLQAALGSDPKREMLGLRLHREGVENCSVLFKPKG